MKIALISDTHDNLKMTERFVEDVRRFAPDYLIHLGDIISPFVIPILAKLAVPGIIVKGNNDGDTDYLGEMCYNAGFEFVIPPHRFKIADKNFLITHRPIDIDKFDLNGLDYYFYGHTHFHKIGQKEGVRVVNPGTVSGYVSGESTYVVVDTRIDEVELIKI